MYGTYLRQLWSQLLAGQWQQICYHAERMQEPDDADSPLDMIHSLMWASQLWSLAPMWVSVKVYGQHDETRP
jgi:hypothetical protein